MRRLSTIVVLSALAFAALGAGPSPPSPGGQSQIEGQTGDCCLCSLRFDGERFEWSCPCSSPTGAIGCKIDSAGCTNISICP